MILIRVDFPAPLSPSTQVTSPARTVRLMPLQGADRAVALADVLQLDQGLALLEGLVGVLADGVGHD